MAPTRADAKDDVFDYIERFYNLKQRFSRLGNLSQMEFENEPGMSLNWLANREQPKRPPEQGRLTWNHTPDRTSALPTGRPSSLLANIGTGNGSFRKRKRVVALKVDGRRSPYHPVFIASQF